MRCIRYDFPRSKILCKLQSRGPPQYEYRKMLPVTNLYKTNNVIPFTLKDAVQKNKTHLFFSSSKPSYLETTYKIPILQKEFLYLFEKLCLISSPSITEISVHFKTKNSLSFFHKGTTSSKHRSEAENLFFFLMDQTTLYINPALEISSTSNLKSDLSNLFLKSMVKTTISKDSSKKEKLKIPVVPNSSLYQTPHQH